MERAKYGTKLYIVSTNFYNIEVQSVFIPRLSDPAIVELHEPGWIWQFKGPCIVVLKSGEWIVCNDLEMAYSVKKNRIYLTQLSNFSTNDEKYMERADSGSLDQDR